MTATMTTTRLDAELVRRGLARSRGHAADLLAAGRVSVDGAPARRAATQVDETRDIDVDADPADAGYASRGAHKLADALDAYGPDGPRVAGRTCLDAGASTGGFTDVLLRRGAARVVAVDVGHGQLVPRLRDDPRVDVREHVNVRDLRAGDVTPAPGLVVADLSFISLTLVIDALVAVAEPGADLVLLVKPQFEVGRERLGADGVVRDPGLWRDALTAVCRRATAAGAVVRDLRPSTLPGTHGNVEFVLRAVAPGAGSVAGVDLATAVDAAVDAASTGGAR
ncbi:TlyA family RNA methyltransferase [Cellulomonas wangsupingiae]|uniref:TlyA family RNA methyltransferase n=1 Tax=Cellulomonas wangsupingiae TaxID=2968085 RepID=A0ABY5KA75_9CELL|nr:TlyA family RNA methyltransferase [Cellulomonas wangsupingiae]MCC2332996.1 TlyA family RNA methyltransferase [Cellulomonas wangsupingiae]MCM0640354.1 TlyA family RNA methyltransferase [Cellulomonas wangsupingiae]UUI66714.1 TlyA family RNA methyltransferase [Cellulomonas wangsupingiae]